MEVLGPKKEADSTLACYEAQQLRTNAALWAMVAEEEEGEEKREEARHQA